MRPYRMSDNATNTLDIAVPATLIAERDDPVRKHDLIRDELFRARELELIRTPEIIDDNADEKMPAGQIGFFCPALPAKIFRFRCRANHLYKLASSRPARGAYHDRHGRWDGSRWTLVVPITNGARAYGKNVWS